MTLRALAAKSVNRNNPRDGSVSPKGEIEPRQLSRDWCRRSRAYPKEGIPGWNVSAVAFTRGGSTQPDGLAKQLERVEPPRLVQFKRCRQPETASIGGSGRLGCQRQAGHPGEEANTLIASASAAEAGLGVVKRRVPCCSVRFRVKARPETNSRLTRVGGGFSVQSLASAVGLQVGQRQKRRSTRRQQEPRARVQDSGSWVAEVGLHASWQCSEMGVV